MRTLIACVSATILSVSGLNAAQSNPSGSWIVAQSPAAPASPPPSAQAAMPTFTQDELKTLLSSIALYPDPLLAQLLPASAYPLEIVQLARWLDKNKDAVARQDYASVDAQNWDPTVKAMARFPTVVQKMNENLDWTSDLGEAFLAQPEDVANAIQDLRVLAQTSGALQSSPQQTVSTSAVNNRDVIVIEPAVPDQIYVPAYTEQVYNPGVGSAVATGLLTFGTAVAVGAIVNNSSWNWGTGAVYPPVWGAPGYRPGRPIINGDVNVGGGNVINTGNIVGNTKPWRPDPSKTGNLQNRQPGSGLDRPNAVQRPANLQRPPVAPMGGAKQIQARPAPPMARPAHDTAFSGIDRGQASAAFANRGAASRAQMAPRGPAGGGRAAIQGGGAQREGAVRGGGGRRR